MCRRAHTRFEADDARREDALHFLHGGKPQHDQAGDEQRHGFDEHSPLDEEAEQDQAESLHLGHEPAALGAGVSAGLGAWHKVRRHRPRSVHGKEGVDHHVGEQHDGHDDQDQPRFVHKGALLREGCARPVLHAQLFRQQLRRLLQLDARRVPHALGGGVRLWAAQHLLALATAYLGLGVVEGDAHGEHDERRVDQQQRPLRSVERVRQLAQEQCGDGVACKSHPNRLRDAAQNGPPELCLAPLLALAVQIVDPLLVVLDPLRHQRARLLQQSLHVVPQLRVGRGHHRQPRLRARIHRLAILGGRPGVLHKSKWLRAGELHR
mmetsp:Transcript_16337/g.31368  ORF Transcript_16337/g.31368 Transcript_16337/m.31368 type:complete len:322 (-) Transcript_16337:2603-3568(-)